MSVDIHPAWNESDVFSGNDIAIITLDSRINITSRVVPACLPMGEDDHQLLQEKSVWTAGLGAINSVRSPGGEIHYEFPFQMKETQLEIQVTGMLGIILYLLGLSLDTTAPGSMGRR